FSRVFRNGSTRRRHSATRAAAYVRPTSNSGRKRRLLRAKTVRCRPLLKHSTPHRTFVGAPVRFRQEAQTPLVPVTGAGEAGPTTSAGRRRRPGAADGP